MKETLVRLVKLWQLRALMMLVSITMVSLYSASNIIIPDTASQLVVAIEAQPSVNSMDEINFSSPFSNSFSLGTPFLVEYDNTTSLKAIENAGPKALMLHSKVMELLMV